MPPRDDSKYDLRTCKQCQGSFRFLLVIQKHNRMTRGQFCSRRCHWAHVRAQQPIHACPKCGKIFTDSPSIRRKYCSLKCSGRAWVDRITVHCQECGKAYAVERKRAANSKCCSLLCVNKYFTRISRIYELDCQRRCHTKGWARLRRQIIERDGGKCRVCGSRLILSIHHKIPWHVVRLDEPANLVTLCKACHYQVEYVEHNYLTRAGVN